MIPELERQRLKNIYKFMTDFEVVIYWIGLFIVAIGAAFKTNIVIGIVVFIVGTVFFISYVMWPRIIEFQYRKFEFVIRDLEIIYDYQSDTHARFVKIYTIKTQQPNVSSLKDQFLWPCIQENEALRSIKLLTEPSGQTISSTYKKQEWWVNQITFEPVLEKGKDVRIVIEYILNCSKVESFLEEIIQNPILRLKLAVLEEGQPQNVRAYHFETVRATEEDKHLIVNTVKLDSEFQYIDKKYKVTHVVSKPKQNHKYKLVWERTPVKTLIEPAKPSMPTTDKEQMERKVKSAQKALMDPNLYKFLKWKYRNENLLERLGKTYPVAIYPSPDAQRGSLESVLLNLDLDPDHNQKPKDLILDPTYQSQMEALGRKMSNDRTFIMDKIRLDGKLGIECKIGRYFDALATCDALEWELLTNWSQTPPDNESSYESFQRNLVLRSALHNKVANPLIDGTGRSAAIGIATLISFIDRENRVSLWVKRRSETNVAVNAGQVHVLPSFMFQPRTRFDTIQEFSVQHNIFREYLEELFNRPDPLDLPIYDYFYGDPPLVKLRELLERGEAEFYFTGIAINLLNLRPEICVLLHIKTPQWYLYHSQQDPMTKEAFEFSEEFAGMFHTDRTDTIIGRLYYSRNDKEIMDFAKGNLEPDRMVPPGAAALWLGIDMLRTILKEKSQEVKSV